MEIKIKFDANNLDSRNTSELEEKLSFIKNLNIEAIAPADSEFILLNTGNKEMKIYPEKMGVNYMGFSLLGDNYDVGSLIDEGIPRIKIREKSSGIYAEFYNMNPEEFRKKLKK
jgi:hypothetical protein